MNDRPFPSPPDRIRLAGKTALVTGGAKGIGFGCARVLGAENGIGNFRAPARRPPSPLSRAP